MFFEILLFILIGFIFGVITGLIPGLHPNTIYIMMLSLIPFIMMIGSLQTMAFVVSLAITNTFFDFIPSIIFGAPEEGSELSVLPGHKMLMEGRAHEAIILTVAGGMFSVILMILSFPLFLVLVPLIYSFLQSYVYLILIGIVFWMISSENSNYKRFWAISIFFISGIYGMIIFGSHNSSMNIFPALTGMFGLSTLIMSVSERSNIPKQTKCVNMKIGMKGPILGWLSGVLVGLLPGVGSSQAGVISAQIMKAKMKDFITALGGINTSNILFTIVVLYAIERSRSGLASFISQSFDVNMNMILISIPSALIAASLCVYLAPKMSWFLLEYMEKVNYSRIVKLMIVVISLLIIILSGLYGVIVCVVGIFIGIFCIQMNIRRSYMMGFFMLNVIIHFSGHNVLFFL